MYCGLRAMMFGDVVYGFVCSSTSPFWFGSRLDISLVSFEAVFPPFLRVASYLDTSYLHFVAWFPFAAYHVFHPYFLP